LLRLLTFDRLPLKETVHRHNAAALAVRLAEGGQIPHGLILRVDRLSAAVRIIAPIRNQTPAERIERDFAGFVIAADDEQFLAGRSVPLSEFPGLETPASRDGRRIYSQVSGTRLAGGISAGLCPDWLQSARGRVECPFVISLRLTAALAKQDDDGQKAIPP
jgi:hypothetical protein